MAGWKDIKNKRSSSRTGWVKKTITMTANVAMTDIHDEDNIVRLLWIGIGTSISINGLGIYRDSRREKMHNKIHLYVD